MRSNKNNLPCEAYIGEKPYAFISYSHKDINYVYPEINRLYNMGYRIWYDEGIPPTENWSDTIALSIKRSVLFVVFLSKNAIESRHILNEICYALNQNKPFLAIHLSNETLPPGIEMQLSSIQAIHKWQVSKDIYIKKLERVLKKSIEKENKTSSYLSNNTLVTTLSQTENAEPDRLSNGDIELIGHDSYRKYHIVSCKSCEQQMRIPTDGQGKVYKCIKCGSLFQMPQQGESPTPEFSIDEKKSIADNFIDIGLVSHDQLITAQKAQQRDEKLFETMLRLRMITKSTLHERLSHEGYATINLGYFVIEPAVLSYIPAEIVIKHWVLPISSIGKLLTVAMVCPLDEEAIRCIAEVTKGMRIRIMLCTIDDFLETLSKHYNIQRNNKTVDVIQCSSCGQRMRIPAGVQAKIYKCVKCGSLIQSAS